MNIESKKVEIDVPIMMNQATAEQCFLLGMKLYCSVNNAGVSVVHGVEKKDSSSSVLVMNFKGDYASATLNFCTCVKSLSDRDDIKNLTIVRDEGSKILQQLEQKV